MEKAQLARLCSGWPRVSEPGDPSGQRTQCTAPEAGWAAGCLGEEMCTEHCGAFRMGGLELLRKPQAGSQPPGSVPGPHVGSAVCLQ